MNRYKHLLVALFFATLTHFVSPDAHAQSVVNMINHDSIVLDACMLGSGTIYDDGGPTGNYSNNFDGWVVIQASAGLTITVTGNYSTESCCDKLTIHDGTTTLLNEAGGTGTVNVTSTTGNMLIRFHTDGSVVYSGLQLNWSVSGIGAACANPVSGLDTTAVTSSSIGLTWTATNAAGPFMVICGDRTVSGITSTSYTLTGLNASTTYEVSVVDASAVENRCCADRLMVRTACGNSSLPYNEGFEGMSEGSFPSCWLQVRNFDDEDYLPQVVSTQHSSGSRSLLLSCGQSESSGHFGIVATPPLQGVGSHTVRLMLRASHSNTRVEFGTCDSAGTLYNQYGFTPVQSFYVNNTGEWQEYRFTWNSPNNGCRLALRMLQSQQNGMARRLYIDDMGIENCGVDSVRTMHVEFDQLDLLWSTYGSPTCNVGVRREGALTDTLSFSNATSPLHITGLAADTRYTFTVYPLCGGTPSISRSVTTRTSLPPTNAATFCSDFASVTILPQNWTYIPAYSNNSSYRFDFSAGPQGVYDNHSVNIHFGSNSTKWNYMASERLYGLAGKQIMVDYGGGYYYNTCVVTIGTMVYPDDTTTFVPLASDTVDPGGRRTLVATVPASSTGRHIAVRYRAYYNSVSIYCVQSGVALVDSVHLIHRRGSTVEFGWAQAYDTVLIQYGPRNFTLGTGTVDTFYHATRGTITGLTPATMYDFYVYRPATPPCADSRRSVRTAMQDYPLPYCENFNGLSSNEWTSYNYLYNSHYGDWQRINSLYEYPMFGAQGYDGYAGAALQLASWGFDWDYYSTALLPDVEIDSNSMLSFYINDFAPNSALVVGVLDEGFQDSYNNWFRVLDTIPINAYHRRVHINHALRPSDTLFDGRLAIRYIHPYDYSYYTCNIDELQITNASYGSFSCYNYTYTTAGISFGSLVNTDSAEVTIVGGGQVIDTLIGIGNVTSLNLVGLDTGTLYRCYIRPFGGCTSYAGVFQTRADGFGMGNCFSFDDLLSYELPYGWASSGDVEVATDDHLLMEPASAVATHPFVSNGHTSFSFQARSVVEGDTLLLGMMPADSIHADSTHFVIQQATLTPIDTFVVGTAWDSYMLRLPNTDTNRIRLVFRPLGDSVYIDQVGLSGCPIVHFMVDGSSLLCTLDPDQATTYYLHITDSTGEDSRVILVNQNTYRVNGLHLNRRYDLWWQCLYADSACHPTVSVRTQGLVPLPYCEDFNMGAGESVSIPATWSFITNNMYDRVELSTDGPSLDMIPNYNRWMYAVMPEFDVDSTMSLHAYFHQWSYDGVFQVGVMNNGTDTSSFIPLWSSTDYYGWQQADVELSGYTDKRVAIRVSSHIRLRNLHVYGYPLAKYSLIGHKHIKVTTEYPGAYWLRYRNTSSYYSNQDTLFYVDTTVFYIHDTNITSSDNVYITQTDSTGYSCDPDRSYYLSGMYNLPYCYNHGPNTGCYSFYSFAYSPNNQSSPTECYWREAERIYIPRFYGNSSGWMVLHDLNIDSIQHAGMRVHYEAGSTLDTVVVGVMVDAYDTTTFTPLDTLVYTIADSVQSTYVDFTRYADTGRWVAFHHLNTPNSQWFDIRYLYLDRCPGSLSATASLSRWNRVKIDGQQVPFYVEYGHSGNGQGSGANTIMRVDSVPIILTLDPETRYDFYFRCDSLGYSCVPKQQVTTLAAPMELPTCVDFDTVAATLIPRNWQRRNPDIGVTTDQSQSGTNSLSMPVASNSYIITPDINVDSIQKVALSLWYKVEDLADRLVVGVMSNPADMSTFHPVRTLAPVEVGVWQHGMVEFGIAPTESHFIALRARSNRQAGGRNIYVDDIYVTDCAAFDFTVQRLTNSSIDLTWSHRGTPNVTVTVEDDGVVTNTYTNVTPPLHIEPLDMLHYYTFRFNSTCGITDTGYCTTNYSDSLSVVTPAPGTGCVNSTDLASPQAVFFRGSYQNPYQQAGAVNYGSSHPDSRHTVCYDTAQRDSRTGGLLRTIPEGYTSSVRLGNWSTNYYTPEAEGVIYSLLVDTGSFELLLLRYAAVLQDPQHAASDQPRFRMELLDTNYNIIDSACTSADFIADQTLGWHTADDGVLWKDWTAVGVDLSAHAGEQVYFRLTTYDCNEGSHYGYAYFTLECMRKNMNTISCGDVDSNTLSAPEGFNYRWYSSQSTTTISTAQSIRVPSEDITYYCDVSKLDNAACHFIISAYGGTRYPMASFDTSMVVDSCRFFVSFTNTSGVSNDGANLLPGEHCETAYWDYGNGTMSVNYHGYAVYDQPGTYTVRLISGIALDECQDTAVMTLVLDLPPGMAPSDTTMVSICDNQWYIYYNSFYNQPGTYYHHVPIPTHHCDSINVLMLDVRPTTVVDTVAVVCDSIRWHGNTYTASADNLTTAVGLNSVNCDSTLRLSLTVNYSQEVNDSIYICPGYPYLYSGVDYGGPTAFDAMFNTVHRCDSLVHVTMLARDSNYHLVTLFRFDSTDWQMPDSVLKSCDPTLLEMRDSTAGAAAWNWSVFMADTVLLSSDSTLSMAVDTGQDAMMAYVNLIVTDTLGCYDTVGWPLFVFRSSIPDFQWQPDLPAMHNPEVQFENITWPDTSYTTDSISFLWRIQSQEGGAFDTTTAVNPFYHWGEEGDNMVGDYTVRLIASWPHIVDSFRVDTVLWVDSTLRNNMVYETFVHTCVDSIDRTVTITNDFLQFPNMVTPNGDGINDTWIIKNLVEFGNYSMNELWIYDRTGAQVYHVKNIRRMEQFWDPNETRSPDGTYYYRFTAKGEFGLVKRNGLIEVLR